MVPQLDRRAHADPASDPSAHAKGAAHAPSHDDGWSEPSRVSGVILVRRPPTAARLAPPLVPVAVVIFAAGFLAGFFLGRATAPPTPRAPRAVVAARRPAPAPLRREAAPPPTTPTTPTPTAAPAPASPTTVGVVEAEAPGHLTAAQVIATQRARWGRARDCVHRARRTHPDLAGHTRIAVIIAPDGRVRNAVWTRAEPSQMRAIACIAGAVRRWRFPPTGYAGDFVAELTFDLATGARPTP